MSRYVPLVPLHPNCALNCRISDQIDVISDNHFARVHHIGTNPLEGFALGVGIVAGVFDVESNAPIFDVKATERPVIPDAMCCRCRGVSVPP
jgi:hypothetical protein